MGGPEGYFSLAIIAFGAFGFIVPKYHYRLGKTDKRSLDSLIYEGYGLQGVSKKAASIFWGYRTLSAIGSAIGRPYLTLSRRISHPQTGRSSQPPHSKPLRGLNRAIVVP